jgi:catechol 2,3-dioxygenase-like lactoylglutathione lyase family enzyme
MKVRGVCTLLQVFDMPASLRFYRDVLGFEIIRSSGPGDGADWVWLGFRHLRAQGIEVEPPTIAPYGMKQLLVRDPDGYELCFQCEASV